MKIVWSPAMSSSVLTLNRYYAAVHIINARRAFSLLFREHAEVICVEDGAYFSYDFQAWQEMSTLRLSMPSAASDEDWVQAVNFRIQVPRIIRLLRYDRLPRPVVKFNRRNVILRDENRCQYCRKHFSIQNLSLDHVMPRSRGGESVWENVVCACLRCNVRKGSRTPQEAGMPLNRTPAKPKQNPQLLHKLNQRKYSSWRKFLDH